MLPPRTLVVPPPAACATYSAVDPCPSESIPTFAGLGSPVLVCARPGQRDDELAIISTRRACPPCGALGGTCTVTLEPRTTRDLPPGGALFVHVTSHITQCDVDCPDPVCIPLTHDCAVPPLVAGQLYRVWYEGTIAAAFTAGNGESACAEVFGGP